MAAIETQNLTKAYGAKLALRDFSLRVPEGALFGFLGPNGAGKTTMLRILLGLLRATGGAARVLGRDAWHDGPTVRRDVGYLPGDVRFWDQRTGRATLRFLDAARGGGSAVEIRRLADLLALPLDQRVRSYSRGMKQKLGLIAALMHRPRLVVLDEPTTALDPLIRARVYDELRAVAADGRTVLFSSHTLAEVQELCDEVAIVRGGRLIEQERIEVLRNRALRRVELHLAPGARLPDVLPDGLTLTQRSGPYSVGVWRGAVPPLLEWLGSCRLADVSLAPPDLEDLFLAYYNDPPERVA